MRHQLIYIEHLQAIKAEGMKAGVALNPHTNVDCINAYY